MARSANGGEIQTTARNCINLSYSQQQISLIFWVGRFCIVSQFGQLARWLGFIPINIMKSCKILRRFIVIIGLLSLAAGQLHAQGTAFTYQGELNSGGNPTTGSYD